MVEEIAADYFANLIDKGKSDLLLKTEYRANPLTKEFWRGQLDKALMHFDKALSANPEYRDAQSNRGRALAQLGRHDEAAAQLAALAATFAADGQLNQALETAQRALEYATLTGNDTASQAICNQLKRYRDE